ncbi:MAG: hypothetical protein OEY01_03625 [Desulfobulbaceae bacterium]|nr:hypothetical protein [Desulfobulbaceae bacterium]
MGDGTWATLIIRPEDLERVGGGFNGLHPSNTEDPEPWSDYTGEGLGLGLFIYEFDEVSYGGLDDYEVLAKEKVSFSLDHGAAGEFCAEEVVCVGEHCITRPLLNTADSAAYLPINVATLVENYNFDRLYKAFFAGKEKAIQIFLGATETQRYVLEGLRSWEDLNELAKHDVISVVLTLGNTDKVVQDYALSALDSFEDAKPFLQMVSFQKYS